MWRWNKNQTSESSLSDALKWQKEIFLDLTETLEGIISDSDKHLRISGVVEAECNNIDSTKSRVGMRLKTNQSEDIVVN